MKTIFELFLFHFQNTAIANRFCFIFVYASCREIQLHHFHQWLMSCSAAYWLFDSSFLSEGTVLHFPFSFLISKTKTNRVRTMNDVGETWIAFSNLHKIREINFLLCVPVSISLLCLSCLCGF